MGIFNFIKKHPVNSLDNLSEQKKMFLINYLGDRSVTWHIDDPVKERYPDIEQNIKDLQAEGLIKIEKGQYVLTSSGSEIREKFRAMERERKADMQRSVASASGLKDYVAAHNARARYEEGSVIPHGIGMDWKQESDIPYNVKNYIECSKKLDFSDCLNSEAFKDALRALYVGISISGTGDISPPDDFEEQVGEALICPALDAQLAEKCKFPNPPKMKIYFRTKVRVHNYISTKLIDKWDGNFDLGVYDCMVPLHADMAQYEIMRLAGIEGFPKTFQTFEKHKKANSPKYQSWMEQYEKNSAP